jgi:hypothetical protein
VTFLKEDLLAVYPIADKDRNSGAVVGRDGIDCFLNCSKVSVAGGGHNDVHLPASEHVHPTDKANDEN